MSSWGRLADFLLAHSFLSAVALLSGLAFLGSMLSDVGGAPVVDVGEATRFINDRTAVIVDVREPAQFNQGHLPSALNFPLQSLTVRLPEIPTDQTIVLCCGSGAVAEKAARLLRARGPVFVLEGGVSGWVAAGLPLVR